MLSTLRLARRGFTSPFGKTMKSLGTLRLHDEANDRVEAEARKLGLPVMEYCRAFLELGHLGRQEVERREMIRLDALERLQPKRTAE